jgi:putative ABC transport system permease protein
VLRTVLAGLQAHARRMAATALAVILGVGFVAGTLIFGDTASAAFYDTFARVAKNVDADVRPAATSGKAEPAPLTSTQLAAIKALQGVAAADGRVTGPAPMLDRSGRPIVNFGSAGFAVSTDGDERMRAFDITGRIPASPAEAVLDTETAAHQHLGPGDSVTMLDRTGNRHVYILVGLIDFGVSKAYSGSTVVGMTEAQVRALTGAAGYDEIVLTAGPGVAQTDLVRAVRAAVGRGPRVVTGDQRRTDLADESTSVATQFTFILLIFGVISLVVAAFVIYNTFAILLAQRVRETALLRCVGATRRQVFAATVTEAAIIGTVGGLLGVVAGIGISYGIFWLLNGVLNAGVPSHAVVLRPGSVLIGLTIGLVVTVLAALVPAVRATRTSPLAALRDLPTAHITGRARRLARLALAVLIGGAGIAVTIAGDASPDPETGTFVIVAGGVVAFLGVLVAAPLYIGALTSLIGLPLRRLAGTPARVAIANTRRNPGRTAITTATIMIGVGLMSLFSVLLASIKQTAHDQIAGHYPIDYVLTGIRYDDGTQAPIPAAVASALRGRPEVGRVAEFRVVEVRINGLRATIGAVDPASLRTLVTPQMTTGSLSDLRPGTAIVSTRRPWVDGRTLYVDFGGHTTGITVAGSAQTSVPSTEAFDALVTWDQLTAIAGPGADTTILVKAAPGIGAATSREAVDATVATSPLVRVNSTADLSSDLETQVNSLVGLFAGLLGTAVLIALFGMANTLSLSVVERTRESATMRAIGLTRPQLRATLLLEALLMGVVGACVGIAYGLVYGPLLVGQAFAAIGPRVVVPWSWLAGLVALAAFASGLAAVLPARRAASGSIVAAMTDL